MAIGDDWKRKREREIEEEEEDVAKKLKISGETSPFGVPSEKLVAFVDRADTLIDQLNNSYRMYVTGAEKLPPTERRKILDQIMVTVIYTGKPTQAMLFRCNSLVSRYNVHKERWDRMIQGLESGKIKRITGPKKNAFRAA